MKKTSELLVITTRYLKQRHFELRVFPDPVFSRGRIRIRSKWTESANTGIKYPYHTFQTSVADPDPVGSGPFWSDPDMDVWDRIWIWILALINDSV
jgi:hypothetical protein